MSAYGNMDVARPGMLDGIESEDIISKVAGVAFAFGDPVFVDAGNATTAVAPDGTDASLVFRGIALESPRSFVASSGLYPAGDMVNVGGVGNYVWVKVVTGLTAIANKPVYLVDDTTSGDYKLFTDVSTSNYDTGAVFASNATTITLGGATVTIALVEMRGIK